MLAAIHWESGWTAFGVVIALIGAWRVAHSDNAVSRAFRGSAFQTVTTASANAAMALAARVDQLEKQVVALVEENKLLKELVTHSAKVDELSAKIDQYQAIVQRALATKS